MDDADLVGNLRNSNLLPKNLEDFKIFVKHLVSSPVHDAAVESVWRIIYCQNGNETETSTENLEKENLKETNCTSIGNSLDICNINNQIFELDKHNGRKSSQESTVSSSSDIEVIDFVNRNIINEGPDESDSSASVEILGEHQAAQPSPPTNPSICAIHGPKQQLVSNEDGKSVNDQGSQDDIVILDEPQNKRTELKKKKKKNGKLKKIEAEVCVIKTILANLCTPSVKKSCVKNASSLLKLKEKNRRKDKNLVKQKGLVFNNVSNSSLREVEKRRGASQDDVCGSSPNASSSSGRKLRDKFTWHDVIVDTINSKPQKRISVDTLKKKVITKYMLYRGNISENTLHKFLKYLHTAPGVIVEDGYAILSLFENIQEEVPFVASI